MGEVRVVVPAYNAEQFLAETIESVLRQSYADLSLVVVDDGSQDGTAAIAGEYARLDGRVTLLSQPNSGVAAARNAGMCNLPDQVEFVMFLDSDDMLLPDGLARLRGLLLDHPTAPAASGLARYVDAQGSPLAAAVEESFGYDRMRLTATGETAAMLPEEPDQFANLVIWPSIATPGQVLIRAGALAAAGPFDPAAVPSDEWDLWIHLSRLGPLPRLLSFTMEKRDLATGLSKKGRIMASAEPYIRHKLATSPRLTREEKRIARLGHLQACRFKLQWVGAELNQGNLYAAGRTFFHVLRSYWRYARTPYPR